MSSSRRIVLVLLEPPLPMGNAAARWYYVMLRELVRRGHQVTAFAACSRAEEIDEARQLFPSSQYDLRCYRVPSRRGVSSKLRSLLRPHSYLFSPELKRDLLSELERGFDVFHLEQLWSGWLAGRFADRAILNVHYLFSIDLAGQVATGRRERLIGASTRRAERSLLRRFRSIATVSPRLSEAVRHVNPAAEVFTVPLGIDPTLYEFRALPSDVGSPVVGLIGSLRWAPTHDAAVRLIERLWPQIQRQVREAKLQIVGRGARLALRKFLDTPGLTVLEDVPDARPYFAEMTCMLYAPPAGSGMKVKVMEAFACGTPVVTNRDGAEGLAIEDGVHAGLAEDDAGLIERAVRLLRDPVLRQRQTEAARRLIEEQYGPVAAVDRLEAVYQQLEAHPPRVDRPPATRTGPREQVRQWLRRRQTWIEFRELQREGLGRALARRKYQRQILSTAPVRTSPHGPVEVRALTWRKDWINLLWALKSFYHFSGVDWPLHIHDGGLSAAQLAVIQRHFPDARIHAAEQTDGRVDSMLRHRGLARSADYRRTNIATRKLWDFFLLSDAQRIVSIDSDVLFFARPDELIEPGASKANRYNRDLGYAYAASPEELEAAFGLMVPPYLNSGLGSVWRDSIDFSAIDRWLEHPRLFSNRWVTEQTLHALCAAKSGRVEFLSERYLVSVQPGLPPGTVCKHYVTDPRPLLYSEGMRRLIETGFLERLSDHPRGAAGERHGIPTTPVSGAPRRVP